MAKEEKSLLNGILKRVSPLGSRLFRQNTGLAWQGDIEKGRGQKVTLYPGDVLLRKARPIHCGLIKGSSDLIGWTGKVITPEMVGKRVAVMTAFEGKATGDGTPEQYNFVDVIRQSGGIAGVVRSDEEAAELVESWPSIS